MSHALPSDSVSPEPPPVWVPVERRRLGLDRRSLLPGLVVAVIGLLFGGVLPLVDDAVAWDDPIAPGERVAIGAVATAAPPAGWQLVGGIRVGEGTVGPTGATATLFAEGVTLSAALTPLPDGPDAALDLLTADLAGLSPDGFTVVGEPRRLTTDGGLSGVEQQWSTTAEQGLITVVALPAGQGTTAGVAVRAKGVGTSFDARRGDIDSTIASIAVVEETGR